MRHQDLQANHILESWVYANAAARTAATGFVPGDVGRISFQIDTGQYFRLLTTAPTWQLIGPFVPKAAAYASQQTPLANPVGTSALPSSPVMMGLAVGHPFIPTGTGKVLATISGSLSNNTAGRQSACVIRYGAGTAPNNGSPAIGSPVGGEADNLSSAAGELAPFTCTGVIYGLAIGGTYWLDLAVWTNGGIASVNYVAMAHIEIP